MKHTRPDSDRNNIQTSFGGFNFDNSYARLPESFYVHLDPVPVHAPRMVAFNRSLAESIGLNPHELETERGTAFFSGNMVPENAQPVAMSYAGHQFGCFTVLGDGRAILLGEQITPRGQRFDIQLKGSGQTPFSRRGDGRAALGPMLREYIVSEAMHALDIPTTRGLAAVVTGEKVFRQTALPGAILTRVATSHIRVGTFEYAARQGGSPDTRTMADYTIWRHYPDLKSSQNPYLSLLNATIRSQASLVAGWQCIGFIHGVMNTDNMALSGETIDYGPCAFMNVYDPATVFSSIDHQGRYAYNNQPRICHWNLARFAETLLPLINEEPDTAITLATQALKSFPEIFQDFWLSGMREKLGLFNKEENDQELVSDLLDLMHKNLADFTNTFRSLAAVSLPDDPLFRNQAFLKWHKIWQKRLSRQTQSMDESRRLMNRRNPAVIPRNHRVEEALEAAEAGGDYSVMQRLIHVLSRPFEDLTEYSEYRLPPDPSDRVYQTFCGT